jgi:hypothetical protein
MMMNVIVHAMIGMEETKMTQDKLTYLKKGEEG